jgi:hypothetical protein
VAKLGSAPASYGSSLDSNADVTESSMFLWLNILVGSTMSSAALKDYWQIYIQKNVCKKGFIKNFILRLVGPLKNQGFVFIIYVYSMYEPKMFEPSHETASLNIVFNTLTEHISSSKVSAARPFLY